MESRIDQERHLLRGRYPALEYRPEGNWVRIPDYKLPEGWNRETTDVAFQILQPPAGPYGIYVTSGLLYKNQRPNNYSEPANTPFPGTWGIFSWAPGDGEWVQGATPSAGSNYLNWALGFSVRFKEGV